VPLCPLLLSGSISFPFPLCCENPRKTYLQTYWLTGLQTDHHRPLVLLFFFSTPHPINTTFPRVRCCCSVSPARLIAEELPKSDDLSLRQQNELQFSLVKPCLLPPNLPPQTHSSRSVPFLGSALGSQYFSSLLTSNLTFGEHLAPIRCAAKNVIPSPPSPNHLCSLKSGGALICFTVKRFNDDYLFPSINLRATRRFSLFSPQTLSPSYSSPPFNPH